METGLCCVYNVALVFGLYALVDMNENQQTMGIGVY